MTNQSSSNFQKIFSLFIESNDLELLKQYVHHPSLSPLSNFLSHTFLELCDGLIPSKHYKASFRYILSELVTKRTDLDFPNDRGQTALMLLASRDSLPEMKALLERGASITVTDNNGENALFYALNNPDTFKEKLILLKEFGVDVDVKNISGVG